MNDEHLGQFDLEFELEGIEKFKEKPIPEFYQITRSKTRSAEVTQINRGLGYHLIRECSNDTIRRYDTLYDFEYQTRPCHDHGFLIGLACQIVESEIGRLLSEPAREVGDVMLKHLDRKKKKKPRDFLEGWLENRIPTMIGVASFILMALRYALDKKEEQAIEFIRQHFRGKYTSLLSANKLGASLDNIRNNFRNPACHGTKTFSPEDYQMFALLCLGATSVREWDRYGPKFDETIQEKAVFLNHLTQSKVIPVFNMEEDSGMPKKDARSEIMSIFQKIIRKASLDTKCHIEVQPTSSARSINRDMTFNDASFNTDFQLNSRINIGYYYTGVQGSVDVTIFDVGTTGKLTVLMPDDDPIEKRISWFPDVYRNQTITLTGSIGMENVFAIATQKKFSIYKLINLEKSKLAQEFTGKKAIDMLEKLTNVLSALSNQSWTIGECEFEIRS